MGMTNLQHSLGKKFSALTGELAEVRANIERIQRAQSKQGTRKNRHFDAPLF
ncbi:hypothetical protein [Sphingobium sp. MK2]|uniref:hypothetical protein n=1 Tax=Sphingobium sp. MK2 TaxID=3116540 RepID=UPI0032E357E3